MRKHSLMIPLLSLCLLLLLSFRPALAADVCKVTPDTVSLVETDKSYIRVSCDVQADADVRVTVLLGDQTVYQRNYAKCAEKFQSEDIYLRLDGTQTIYTVCVDFADTSYETQVVRKVSRLTGNTACATGISLKTITGQKSWLSCTVLDLKALEKEDETYPVHASNAYTLGDITFSMSKGRLTATYTPPKDSDVTVASSQVDIAFTPLEARTLGTKRFRGEHTSLDTPVSVGDAAYACVLVQLKVSYTPSDLPASPKVSLEGQSDRWEEMQQSAPDGSNG